MALFRHMTLRCDVPIDWRSRGPAFSSGLLCALAASLFAHGACAQTAPPPAAEAPSDRAKRDADKVYQMILMHADKPRRATAVPVPATAQRMPKPAAAAAADARKVVSVPGARTRPLAAGATSPLLGDDNPALTTPAASPTPEPPAGEAPQARALPGSTAAPLPAPNAVAAKPVLELVSSVTPEFPRALVRRLGSGSVVVNFEVLPDGSVGATTIVKTSHQGLNGAAQAAVAAWRFKPISEAADGVTELRFE